MTSPDTPINWPELCEGVHPSEPVMCALLPGPNATDTEGTPVHVHKGLGPDGTTHRWEDAPPAPEHDE